MADDDETLDTKSDPEPTPAGKDESGEKDMVPASRLRGLIKKQQELEAKIAEKEEQEKEQERKKLKKDGKLKEALEAAEKELAETRLGHQKWLELQEEARKELLQRIDALPEDKADVADKCRKMLESNPDDTSTPAMIVDLATATTPPADDAPPTRPVKDGPGRKLPPEKKGAKAEKAKAELHAKWEDSK